MKTKEWILLWQNAKQPKQFPEGSKRLFDLITAVQALIVFLVPAGLVALAVLLTSKGPIIYWSDRVGRYNKIFKMPKFRTMQIGTPTVATHLMVDNE